MKFLSGDASERKKTVRWNPRVKYQAELDPEFPKAITALPGAEKLWACIQCGTCTGVCPMSPYMDYSPRRLMDMTRSGFKRDVLSSFTLWLCSSCYACTVSCPKGIKVTEVMYALKRHAIREGVYPRRFSMPVLAREFFQSVRKHGRSSEGRLIIGLFLRTNINLLFRQMGLGWKLWRQGRLSLKTESVERRDEVKKLLSDVKATAGREAAA